MKKILSLFAAGVLLFAACCKDTAETPTKSITFSCSGDWQQNAKDLTANGSSMTDVWVFDYVDNTLVQTIHQDDNTAADFGSPSLDLSFGTFFFKGLCLGPLTRLGAQSCLGWAEQYY